MPVRMAEIVTHHINILSSSLGGTKSKAKLQYLHVILLYNNGVYFGSIGTLEALEKATRCGLTWLPAPLEYIRQQQRMNKLDRNNMIHKQGTTKQKCKLSMYYTILSMITMYRNGTHAQRTLWQLKFNGV